MTRGKAKALLVEADDACDFYGHGPREFPDAMTVDPAAMPCDTRGLKIKRMTPVFGLSDAPPGHGEVRQDNVRVHTANILLGKGRGFEIVQEVSWTLADPSLHVHDRASVGAEKKRANGVVNVVLLGKRSQTKVLRADASLTAAL